LIGSSGLEEKSLVVRERDKHDRRVVHVKLTEKGKKLYRVSVPTFENSVADFFSPLDNSQQKELSTLLRKLLSSH